MYDSPIDGRMSRQNFILSQLVLLGLTIIVLFFVFFNGVYLANINYLIPVILAALIPQTLFTIRRLHDINATGLWSVLIIAPYISLLFMIYISYKKGDPIENRFGTPDTRKLFGSILNKKVM